MSHKTHATHASPCAHCGSTERCSVTADGLHLCLDTSGDARPGFYFLGHSRDGAWGLYRADGTAPPEHVHAIDPAEALAQRHADQVEKLHDFLAGDGATIRTVDDHPAAFTRLSHTFKHFTKATYEQLPGVAYIPTADLPEGDPLHRYTHAFGFPERDGDGQVIGYNFRWPNGRKQSRGARGITIPQRLLDADPHLPPPQHPRHKEAVTLANAWTIYVVEGASDVLAMTEMGLCAIGRPSATGGAPEIAQFIANHLPTWRWRIIVVGENDRKDDGRHPGLDGAQRVAQSLADALDCPVHWALPPAGHKDVRAWFETQLRRKGRPTSRRLGIDLDSHLESTARTLLPQATDGDSTITTHQDATSTPEEQAAYDNIAQIHAAYLADSSAPAPEHAAATHIAHARAMHHDPRYRCCRPRPLVLYARDTNAPRMQSVRCEDFVHCDGCRRWRIFRELANATLRFHGVPQLYEMLVVPENWATVRRWITRHGGDYLRTHEDCAGSRYYVVTDAPHPDAILTTPHLAHSTVRTLLDAYDCQARPVATSHGWKLPVLDRAADRYVRVGMAPRWMSLRILRQIADELDLDLNLQRSPDASRTVMAADLLRWDGWDDDTRDWVCSCLMAGEVLPRIEHVTFKPLTRPGHDVPIPADW